MSKSKIAAIWGFIALIGAAAGWLGYRSERAAVISSLIDDAKRCAVVFDAAELRQLTGTKADAASPLYTTIKQRLVALQAVNPRVRFVYIFRSLSEKKVIYLADSAKPGAKDESLPGDDYPQAAQSPGLQEILLTGHPTTEGPLKDDFGTWVTGYAAIDPAPPARPNEPGRHVVGMDLDVADWSRMLWGAAFSRAFYVWVLLGVPFSAWLMLRRQHDQREAIRNLSEAMEQSHSALMIVDLHSCIEYANRGLCQQIGYSRRELLGRKWRDFQVAETPPEMLAEMVTTVRSGRPWEGEWFNRRKDGLIYPVRGVITPVKRRDGTLACFVAVFDDMTEIKRKEAELRDARDQAEAGDRAKGQFLATMSHEVRTPLNGIVGFTNLLLDTPMTPEQRDYVQTIRSSGEALIQLTGDILDFARIESGRLALEPVSCDPRECVEEALDLFAAAATAKKLEMLHWIDDAVPAMVLADGGRLRQVLVNLVNNAVKFTDKGEVEVSVDLAPLPAGSKPAPAEGRESVMLRFTVRDTGIGIAPDQHAKLFKPFSQLDGTSTRKFGGTGLGLAICRNLVHLMGGEIHFECTPGRGTRFIFTVSVPVLEAAKPAPDLAGLRLAVVAPVSKLREEISRLAARWRAHAVEVEDGQTLQGIVWDVALVEVDEALARKLAATQVPLLGLPAGRTFGLVPISLPTDLRTGLRAHFRLLINKPVHHGALYTQLSGLRTAPVLTTLPPAHYDLRVLLVEDNPVNQRLMQKVLTNLGCKWVVAENGRRAIEELQRAASPFDFVLMDIHMPELDGIAAICEIREGRAGEAAKDIWIAALTADARDDQRARAMDAGANDYMTKPMRQPEIDAALRRFRDARNAARG